MARKDNFIQNVNAILGYTQQGKSQNIPQAINTSTQAVQNVQAGNNPYQPPNRFGQTIGPNGNISALLAQHQARRQGILQFLANLTKQHSTAPLPQPGTPPQPLSYDTQNPGYVMPPSQPDAPGIMPSARGFYENAFSPNRSFSPSPLLQVRPPIGGYAPIEDSPGYYRPVPSVVGSGLVKAKRSLNNPASLRKSKKPPVSFI